MSSTLFVLMMYTYNMRYDGWTISGAMTKSQCEAVKEEISKQSKGNLAIGEPMLMICKEVPSGENN